MRSVSPLTKREYSVEFRVNLYNWEEGGWSLTFNIRPLVGRVAIHWKWPSKKVYFDHFRWWKHAR